MIGLIRYLTFLLIVFVLAAPLRGQSDAEAVAIVNDALIAHGGTGAVDRAVPSSYLGLWEPIRNGIVSGPALEFEVQAGAGGALRSRLIRPDASERIYIQDGRQGWVVRDGVKKPLSARASANRLSEINPLSGVLWAHQQGQLSFSASRPVDGENLLEVDALLIDPARSLDPRPLVLDRRYLIRFFAPSGRVASMTELGRGRTPVITTEYDQYRQVDGDWIPFLIRTRDGSGQLINQLRLQEYLPGAPPPDVREP